MNVLRKPREGCDWTDERCLQLEKLEWMLRRLCNLDNGSGFLTGVQQCITDAKELSRGSPEEWKSFKQFLIDQAIKDRFGDTE